MIDLWILQRITTMQFIYKQRTRGQGQILQERDARPGALDIAGRFQLFSNFSMTKNALFAFSISEFDLGWAILTSLANVIIFFILHGLDETLSATLQKPVLKTS